MNSDYFRRLYDYNFWAHRQVWACALELTDEQFARPHNYSIGSMHAQLVHTMGAEWLWLERLHGTSHNALPTPAEYPTREAIRARWDTVEADWRAYLNNVTEFQITQKLEYQNLSGKHYNTPLFEILMHVANHGTDHRAQMLALLHHLGTKTIEQDVIVYVREKPSL
jgi:uncharacterized damage-inducible protein DinB